MKTKLESHFKTHPGNRVGELGGRYPHLRRLFGRHLSAAIRIDRGTDRTTSKVKNQKDPSAWSRRERKKNKWTVSCRNQIEFPLIIRA